LFLATTDEGLLRAAALLDLWRDGFVESVAAPPQPYHILAQQLMALVLQERGVGRSEWFEWVATVPGFAVMDRQAIADIVDFMIRSGVLWADNGVLAFAPEGEAKYGRKHFMDLLSVFTSPPLFRVMAGQKELGSVHESTFYKRDAEPPVIVLAGRSWKTNHLDWKRRVAHVEPAEERGRSRWLGEGQFLSHRVCQCIRHLLADETDQPLWSQRATAQINEIRTEYPWASTDATSIVRHPSGEVRWWTFGGGVANTLLADHLRPKAEVRVDNLSIRFTTSMKLNEVEELIGALTADRIKPIPAEDAIEGLKFSECLPPHVAAEVFCARFKDAEAVRNILGEPKRVVVED
jgi:ATP-dependent Lhr-like helicase